MSVVLFGLPVGPELILIILVLVLLFGANRLPKLARSGGQAIGEFQKGKEEAEEELKELREDSGEEGEEDSELEDLTEEDSEEENKDSE